MRTQDQAKEPGRNCDGPPQARGERPTWIEKARRLRKLGWSYGRIAAELELSSSTVYTVLDVTGAAHANAAARTRRWKERKLECEG